MQALLHSVPPYLKQATADPGLCQDSWTLTAKSGSVSCGVTAPFSWILVCTRYTMGNAGLDEAQAGIKIVRRNINNLKYANNTTLMAESEEELKSLWMRMKEESEKAGLKLNIKKTKIMASGPITSWHIDGETVKTVTDFIFLAPKSPQMVTAAMKLKDTCFLEEKL